MNSVVNHAQHAAFTAADQVKSAADGTRSSLIELGVQALKLFNHVRAQETRYVDSALDHIGLQRRESALRPVLWFAAGAVVAGGAALVLAPSSGEMLRKRLIELLSTAGDSVKSAAEGVTHSALVTEVTRKTNHVEDKLMDGKEPTKEKQHGAS